MEDCGLHGKFGVTLYRRLLSVFGSLLIVLISACSAGSNWVADQEIPPPKGQWEYSAGYYDQGFTNSAGGGILPGYVDPIYATCTTISLDDAQAFLENRQPGVGDLNAVSAVKLVDDSNTDFEVDAIEFQVSEGGTKTATWFYDSQQGSETRYTLGNTAAQYTAWDDGSSWDDKSGTAASSALKCLSLAKSGK